MDKIIALILIFSLVLAPASAVPEEQDPEREMQTEVTTIQGTEDEIEAETKKKPAPVPAEETEEPAPEMDPEETEVLPEEEGPDPQPILMVSLDKDNFFEYFEIVENRTYIYDDENVPYQLSYERSVRMKPDIEERIAEGHEPDILIRYSYMREIFQYITEDPVDLSDLSAIRIPGDAQHYLQPIQTYIEFPKETLLYEDSRSVHVKNGMTVLSNIHSFSIDSVYGTLYLYNS